MQDLPSNISNTNAINSSYNQKRRIQDSSDSPLKKIKMEEHDALNQSGGQISDLLGVVKEVASYAPFGDGDMDQTIIVLYPLNAEIYPLVVPLKDDYDPIIDILQTMKIIGEEIIPKEYSDILGTFKTGIIKMIKRSARNQDVQSFREHVDSYNRGIVRLREKGVFYKSMNYVTPAPLPVIEHIMEQSYARIVATKTNALRKYEGFSNNVYGEILHPFVNQIIKHSDLKASDTFLDMVSSKYLICKGSGIGNVVLQVAAQTLCEAIGIEIMEAPADLGIRQAEEFIARMKNYSLACGKIKLKKGDFLEDEEIHDVIKRADVIFVNNYAFDAALNQAIIAKFLDIKDSCKIVSLKSFVPVDRRLTLHRSNSIESIFDVKELYFGKEHVSWMNEPGKYYIHTINRQKEALESE